MVADFVAAAQEASDDLSAIAGVMVAQPLPFLPDEVHGELVLASLVVHAGDTSAGRSEVDQLRKLAKPLRDDLEVMRYVDMFPSDESGRPQPAALSMRSNLSDEIRRAQCVRSIGDPPGIVSSR